MRYGDKEFMRAWARATEGQKTVWMTSLRSSLDKGISLGHSFDHMCASYENETPVGEENEFGLVKP